MMFSYHDCIEFPGLHLFTMTTQHQLLYIKKQVATEHRSPFIYLLVCVSVSVGFYLYLYLSISIYIYIYPSIRLSVHLSIHICSSLPFPSLPFPSLLFSSLLFSSRLFYTIYRSIYLSNQSNLIWSFQANLIVSYPIYIYINIYSIL